MPKLDNPRWEAFANLLIKHAFNQSRAYREAFNTKNDDVNVLAASASRLLRNDKVQRRISELQSKIDKKSERSLDDMIADLHAIKERCMQAEPVRDKNGNETGEYRFDANGAAKAIQLEMQARGHLDRKDRIDVHHHININDALEEARERALKRLAEKAIDVEAIDISDTSDPIE